MPQIYVMIAPKVKGVVVPKLDELDRLITNAVVDAFGRDVAGDVSCTAVETLYVRDDGDVQIEIRYTAGGDEYRTGRMFDPGQEQMDFLVRLINGAMETLFSGTSMNTYSVWIIPFRGTVFHYQAVPLPQPKC